jgi:hypothetical protein
MQDIAGCRAVVESVPKVQRLRALYADDGYHEFKGSKDYIASPKSDGYRGIHLIYRFKGTAKTQHYDDLQVEIQIRSQLQHAWATAVEAVGIFTKQALKWRGGSADWQRFVVLMGSAIAKIERCPLVDGTPTTKHGLKKEIKKLVDKLNVRNTLKVHNMTVSYVGSLKKSEARLLLVHMVPDEGSVNVQGFRLRESQQANYRYTLTERGLRKGSADQVVLVKVDSLQAEARLPKLLSGYRAVLKGT